MKQIFFFTLLSIISNIAMSQNDRNRIDYTEAWTDVEKLKSERLPQSLLSKLDEIYRSALLDEDYEHVVKAIVYRAAAQEDAGSSINAILDSLTLDVKRLPQPSKSIVYAITGDVLLKYYNRNRWKIKRRTYTDDGDDIQTWNIVRLFREMVKYYTLSVNDEDVLQQTPFKKYDFMVEEVSDEYRDLPLSLYEGLCLHAINALNKNTAGNKPQQAFVMNKPEYFADVQTFVNCDIITDDTLSSEYLVISLYRQLLKYRLQLNENPKILVAMDLERLKYAHVEGRRADKDVLYEKALERLADRYADKDQWCRIAYSMAVFYLRGQDDGDDLASGFRLKKAYDLCNTIIAKTTDDKLSKQAQDMMEQITSPSISLSLAPVHYPDSPILAFVRYKNTDTLYLWFFKVSEYNTKKSLYNIDPKDFASKKPAATQTVVLPSRDDYNEHSTEMIINGLPQGIYTVFATNSTTFQDNGSPLQIISNTTFQVSSLTAVYLKANKKTFSQTLDDSQATINLYVADLKSGKPVKNAKIEYKEWDSKVKHYVTDSEGMAYIPHTDADAQKITVIKDNNRFVMFYPSIYFFDASTEKETQTVFLTDRSIYRPGQTVYYKVICFTYSNERLGKLLTKTPFEVEFRDVNNRVIASQRLITNEFGSIEGNFVIPQNLLNGQMSLHTKYGRHAIQVAEYKRPAFEVKFLPTKDAYRLNDSIQIVGTAKALADYGIDHARVQYRIVRNLQYRSLRWWYTPIREPSREIASGIVTTDNSGQFCIDFKAEAADVKYDDMIYRYDITAEVTDDNGETQSAYLSVQTGKTPLLINSSVPRNIISGNSLSFDLNTTNLNGDFVPADVEITLTELKPPARTLHARLWEKTDTLTIPRSTFESLFPLDPYGDEDNPEKYVDGKQIVSYQIKTVDSVALNKLNLEALSYNPSGWYRIDIKAKTEGNIETDDVKYIQFINRLNPAPLIAMNDWMTLINDSAEPGENIELLVAGANKQSYIHCDLILNNRIVEQKTIIAGNIPKQIDIPVKEEYRGGFTMLFVMIQNGRTYTASKQIAVPYANKLLDIEFTSFRNKLLPGEHEKWSLTVKNKNGGKEIAEMAATLYDASLDAFTQHSWSDLYSLLYRQRFSYIDWQIPYSTLNTARNYKYPIRKYELSEYELSEVAVVAFGTARADASSRKTFNVRGLASTNRSAIYDRDLSAEIEASVAKLANIQLSTSPDLNIVPRRNFNETAFFYPQLRTDEHGETKIEFTVPESLTRWKMLGLSHTADLKVGTITNELITRKEVMITANAPRFFRENDVIEFTAKISNISDSCLAGQATLHLYDASSMQPLDTKIMPTAQSQNFSVKANESTVAKWTLKIPVDLQALTYKVIARAGNHSDGEEKTLPVIPNSTMVVETMPFSIRAGQEQEFVFNRLKNNHSKVQRNHRLTLEFTSNPAWYAIQSIPYLMEYPYECTEQTFARFYANSLASKLVNSSPRVKQIFDAWRGQSENGDALLSNLEKNQELKQALLEETPWVMQAQNESERKKRTALLFDLNKMNYEQKKTFDKLVEMQSGDGGFSWFNGLPANRFITQHIVAGIEHLKKLNALNDDFVDIAARTVERGLKYLDAQLKDDYENLQKIKNINLEQRHIKYLHLHHLYAYSFGKRSSQNGDEAVKYYYRQAEKYWTEFNLYAQAITALVMNRAGDRTTAMKIIRSLKERSQRSDEMGMYWNDNVAGYFWYQAPVETQAMLIEAFDEVANDKQAVEEMKIWLLRNKQTNSWNTTKATTEACYALLNAGGNLLDESRILDVKIAGKPLAEIAGEKIRPDAGSGYVKTAWNANDISTEMAVVQVANPNSKGIAWGGMYWQYFETFDRITGSETNLKLNKQLFLKTITSKGEELLPLNDKTKAKVGDIVVVRLELRADRDYEYVHLKDMRASSFEPVKTVSGHRYQDGLWYYENVKDASSNFFITYLRKGTYVFGYELRVTHAGEFSNGITTFQCMYAPEFNAHSGGVNRIDIKEK